jgi:hypothetical protein
LLKPQFRAGVGADRRWGPALFGAVNTAIRSRGAISRDGEKIVGNARNRFLSNGDT